MTRREIIDTLLDYGGQPSGGDFEDMCARAMERYYRKVLASTNQDNQLREFDLATVASTQDYGLPLPCKRIVSIVDDTNDRSLEEITRREYSRRYPGTATSGTPRTYANIGRRGVQFQPSSASVITMASSLAADASGNYLRVKGFDANNVEIDERLTYNGTTNVVSSAAFTTIETLVKSSDTGSSITGVTTVTSNSAAVTLSRIPVMTTTPWYTWLRFYPIPDGVLTLTCQVVTRKEPLFRDDSWPEFDEDFHHLLITGPGSEVLPAIGKGSLGQKMFVEYTNDLNDFKGVQKARPNLVQKWADVSNRQVVPDRPLISGIDYL